MFTVSWSADRLDRYTHSRGLRIFGGVREGFGTEKVGSRLNIAAEPVSRNIKLNPGGRNSGEFGNRRGQPSSSSSRRGWTPRANARIVS